MGTSDGNSRSVGEVQRSVGVAGRDLLGAGGVVGDGEWSDLRRASLADTRRRYEVACWEAVHGDLGGADSAEWAAHVAWCFVAGWRPLVCVGYWIRGGKRGSAVR